MPVAEFRDKCKDNEILLENHNPLKLSKEVMRMAVSDPELLNSVYKEVSEKLGMDTAMEIYRMFKGQQISFMSLMTRLLFQSGSRLGWKFTSPLMSRPLLCPDTRG